MNHPYSLFPLVKKILSLPCIILCLSFALCTGAQAADRFTDVPRDSWCYWTVEWVVQRGIMAGITDTRFYPDDTADRATAISMLYNAEGRPPHAPSPFHDVPEGAWYADAAAWGADTGIAEGYGGGRFGPADPLTRQQFVTMLYRLISRKGEGYQGPYAFFPRGGDWNKVSSYARESVSYMVMHGFMEGDENPVNPQGPVTRAQAATMLARFYQYLTDETLTQTEGVYLGVEGYGADRVNEFSKNNFRYRFFVAGNEIRYPMDNGNWVENRPVADDVENIDKKMTTGPWTEIPEYTYDLQNLLKEGDIYRITLRRGIVVGLEDLTEGTAVGITDTASGTAGQTGTDGTDAITGSAKAPVRTGEHAISGTVESLTDSSITVAGQTLPLSQYAGFWRIRTAVGGASVTVERPTTGSSVYVTKRSGLAGNVYLCTLPRPYTPPVSGTPGLRTIKNFLATSLMPVGVTLYQYGGGWNWQDRGGNAQTTTIGVPHNWVDFFRSQNTSYTYKDPDGNTTKRNPAKSYYPFGMYGAYNYLGADCAGFVGWALYNTMNTDSGGESFLGSAMALKLSQRGWGTWIQYASDARVLKPGDVVGIAGHIYISLGCCPDGSAVIVHSTPSTSKSGNPGGGVQLSAIGNSKNCEAYRLADRYMKDFFPQWYQRYGAVLKSPGSFYAFGEESRGRFRWDTVSGPLSDPDGFQNKSANEVLAALFGK